MPEAPAAKSHLHPWQQARLWTDAASRFQPGDAPPAVGYCELQVTSNCSFLTGASHPDELVQQAASLGMSAIAVTDINSLAGIVRAHVAARTYKIRLIIGCHLRLYEQREDWADLKANDGSPQPPSLDVLVYPADLAAYSRLCQLLTLGKRRAPKGECYLALHDLLEHQHGMLAIMIPPRIISQHFIQTLQGLRQFFDNDRLSLAATCSYHADDQLRLQQLNQLSQHTGVPLVATNDVHYHHADRRPLQDVLTCIRHGCTLDEAGLRLFPNAERCLKPPQEMARLFASYPQAIARTVEIAHRTRGFNLDQLRYQYPDEICPGGDCMQHLIQLTWKGAREHFPQGVPEKVQQQIEHEFTLIAALNYAPYFLTVHDLVVFARSQGILCQGRGAAANSAVCFCLGITSVDPSRIDMLFERFVSKERNEPPDIDVDFEHERREEVIQYIYRKYGRDRAGLTAEVISYRHRSAVRDVGKAMGLSLDTVDRLARNIDGSIDPQTTDQRVRELGLDPREPTLARMLALVKEIIGFPRHLSQHVGGFVITRGRLCDMVPIENAAMEDRTIIEWDKDDIDAMGMLKVDVLALGMLTCISKAFDLIAGFTPPSMREHPRGQSSVDQHPDGEDSPAPPYPRRFTLATVPAEEPAVYDMICKADTIGVFQIESRAQMSMLPRLRPRCYYDLVIEVAIVRPGPIQGDMVHPYLRRRNGDEPIVYPDEQIRRVLGRTLGVPLFQEQAMSLAMEAAGFSAGEADQLRRAIAAWKSRGSELADFEHRIIGGMLQRGYDLKFAQQCFQQIKGFSGYGFPESHSASFALLVYVSAWLKCRYPAAFAAALLNSQPMGFYAPAQIVRDAREHGVTVRGVDVNHSQWDCTLEPIDCSVLPAVRLGMRQVRGVSQLHACAVARAVAQHGPFHSMQGLWRASGVPVSTMRKLAAADAFASMGLDRQSALWQVHQLRDEHLPLLDGLDLPDQPEPMLPLVPEPRKVVQDYQTVGLSLRPHPVSFIREQLSIRRVRCNSELQDEQRWPSRRPISVAGQVLVRQRPGTASGIVFMTIEDETGIANLILRPKVFEQYRKAARHGVVVIARGHIERQGEVVHVVVSRLEDAGHLLRDLISVSRDFH